MRLGLVLLPPPAFSRTCADFARALVVDRTPRVVLGGDALAHVTLVHVETDRDPVDVWNAFRGVLPASLPIQVQALGLLRYDVPYNAPPAAPATMAWLMIPGTPALRAAEQTAIGAIDLPPTTGIHDQFQPHMTIAIWEGEVPPALAVLPRDLFQTVEATLALGVIGPNGTYQRTLFSAF